MTSCNIHVHVDKDAKYDSCDICYEHKWSEFHTLTAHDEFDMIAIIMCIDCYENFKKSLP